MKRAAPQGRPFSCSLRKSALLRVLVAILIGTLTVLLAILATLLLLLAALFFVAVSLRVFLVLLVGGVSHFPSPFAAPCHHAATSDQPPGSARCSTLEPGRGWRGTGARRSGNRMSA
jgi:fatty acid desaturase